MRQFIFGFLLTWSTLAFSEPAKTRVMTVLPTTDTSDLGLAKPLQNAMGILAQDSGMFTVKSSDEPIPGFTKEDIATMFHRSDSELMGFVYLESGRLSLFLFDTVRMGEFILAFELLNPPDGNLTNVYVEERFRAAWSSVVAQYMEGAFQPLPGSAPDEKLLAKAEEQQYKAVEAKRLFRELASIEDRSYYAGANIGMSRFSQAGSTASTVNFGGVIGARLSERVHAELGFDVFSYFMPHAELRYTLPLEERHIFLSLSGGVGTIMGTVTQNRGFASTTLKTGSTMLGPGLSFDIPLLGVNVRGDLRMYFGSATILLGTYGIVYAL